LVGKHRCSQPLNGTSWAENTTGSPPVSEAHLYDVMDVLDAVAAETGKSVPQIALNWVLVAQSA
jgi:aryl-alcohol dehydrogenase-like predicted oxidoreductase